MCSVVSLCTLFIISVTPAENAQVLSLMLEVSQWLGQFTLEVFWPREARCFMKGDLILAQKLGLATRYVCSGYTVFHCIIRTHYFNPIISDLRFNYGQGPDIIIFCEGSRQPL